jgi:predicted O-methyltransferase YrrM
MNDYPDQIPPLAYRAYTLAGDAGFTMSCEPRTGMLLATLAASKPAGRILEIGTGAGAGSAWLLAGMDRSATLTTIEVDADRAALARQVLNDDGRVVVINKDARTWLTKYVGDPFDLVFCDWRTGKFDERWLVLRHLALGGIYVGDDLLPQPTWPDDHQPRVDQFVAEVVKEPALVVTLMSWASGLVVASRRVL